MTLLIGIGIFVLGSILCALAPSMIALVIARAIQGLAGSFVVKLVGSYSNVVGLPLYETASLLGGEGYSVHFGWLNAV